MSDLELVLRRRLESVKKGVAIGTDVLQAAQDAKGYSNEWIARELYISEKTWRRWKEIGEVPRQMLPAVIMLLDLEIEEAGRKLVTVTPPGGADPVGQEILRALGQLTEQVKVLAAAVERQQESR